MTESGVRWLSHVLSTSPGHAVGRPDHEIITFIRSGVSFVLITGTRSLSPASKHKNIRATNVESVAESVLWGSSTNSKSGPNISVSIKYADVIEVAFLKGSSLRSGASFLHSFVTEPESSMNDQVASNQHRAVTFTGARCRSRAIGLRPSHDL